MWALIPAKGYVAAMAVLLLFALFVTVGVTLLLVGILRRINPPPPGSDGESAG